MVVFGANLCGWFRCNDPGVVQTFRNCPIGERSGVDEVCNVRAIHVPFAFGELEHVYNWKCQALMAAHACPVQSFVVVRILLAQ